MPRKMPSSIAVRSAESLMEDLDLVDARSMLLIARAFDENTKRAVQAERTILSYVAKRMPLATIAEIIAASEISDTGEDPLSMIMGMQEV